MSLRALRLYIWVLQLSNWIILTRSIAIVPRPNMTVAASPIHFMQLRCPALWGANLVKKYVHGTFVELGSARFDVNGETQDRSNTISLKGLGMLPHMLEIHNVDNCASAGWETCAKATADALRG